jgi:asparagine N-glycosylation enzyme membrane subunit Stt3
MFEIIVSALIAFLSMMIPGYLLALALLRKTGLSSVEIAVMGFIFGLMAPTTLTWIESYLIPISSFFSFSLGLFEINAALLTVIGILLCWKQGVFKNFKAEILQSGVSMPKVNSWIWILLLIMVLLTFITRLQSIYTAPTFFEFDPYFDMADAQSILTFGNQMLNDTAAWPVAPAGTNHRIQPLVPYIESYWYSLYTSASGTSAQTFSTTLMSYVGGIYPPIAGALLVFVVFMLIYREYDPYLGLLAAGFTATMPILYATFMAGEQLVEPWGIFALFFFAAAYLLAVKNPKSYRLAILAGIAFASNFLGAHYYTVTAGVLAAYIMLQGVISVVRGDMKIDFYKMNAVVLAVIAVFLAFYQPYQATLTGRISSILGLPLILSLPLFSLILVAVMDYVPRLLHKKGIVKSMNAITRLSFVALIILLAVIVTFTTSLGNSLQSYINLGTRFTTPSSPLFMTVEEYIPTGLGYNFAANGLGLIASGINSAPLLVWVISALALLFLAISIWYRKNNTAIMYMAIALPLMVAGFSEVKYLPHFGVAFILFFVIVLGEILVLTEHGLGTKRPNTSEISAEQSGSALNEKKDTDKLKMYRYVIYAIGLFFFSAILSFLFILYVIFKKMVGSKSTYMWGLFVIFLLIEIVATIAPLSSGAGGFVMGESLSFLQSMSALAQSGTPQQQLCSSLANQGSTIGYTDYCNQIPQYWLNAMSWLNANVGPAAPRVLAWWDYGDWINWFGNTNAVLRGDNANAPEDYATAAHFVLGTNDGYGPSTLANFMNGNQTKYVLFDQDLISKWQALDFLGCIRSNGTSYNAAIAAGASQSPPAPFLLGTSQCELSHDPQFTLVPYSALVPTNQSFQSLSDYCNMTVANQTFIKSYLLTGNNFSSAPVCVSGIPNRNGVLKIYNQSGKALNAVIQSNYYEGIVNLGGQPYVEYLTIYLPNTANGIINDAPSQFYNSNYYKGFVLGKLPGFTEVYPANATGLINYVNGTWPVRIYELNNFTGSLPPIATKPNYIHNNYTMPGA